MSHGDDPRGFPPPDPADEQNPREDGETAEADPDPIERLFRYQPPSRANSRVSSTTMAGVSPSGDSLYSSSRGSRFGAGAFMRSESSERLDDSGGSREEDSNNQHARRGPIPASSGQQQQQSGAGAATAATAAGPDQHAVGPVDRLLLLVDDGQSLSRRVLGNERQSARLGERLSALKTPMRLLQARVRTQAERPPGFVRTLTEEVSHCLDVLLDLTHPEWWNQIRRKVTVFQRERDRDLEAAERGTNMATSLPTTS